MVRLPRYTAETPPPREPGLARATDIDALTRTGDIEVWRGVSQIGRSMEYAAKLGGAAYLNRQALDDQATMGEISKRAQDADTEAVNTVNLLDPSVGSALPDNPKEYYDGTKLNRFDNPTKEEFIDTTYKDYEAKILNLAKGIKNPKTRQAWINSQLPAGYKKIKDAANLKHQEYQEQLILGNARTAAANGDMELSNKWVDIAEKYGLVGPKRAAIERINNQKIASQSLINNVHAAIEAASDPDTGTGNFQLARELAKNPLIPEPKQTSLRTAIKTAESIYKNKQKTLTDIYIEQAHKTSVTALIKEPDNIEFINDLPGDLQEFWQDKLNKRATSLEKGEDTFNQYDPILYSGLKQQIRETPDKVDYMDIIDSVGNGLIPAQAQELFELQDKMQLKDNPLAQSHIKRAHDRINDLQTAGLTIKGIKPPTAKSTPEEAIEYMNVFDEMHEGIDRNAELKPAEMRKYTEEMVRPIAEEAGKSFWEMLKGGLGMQPTTYGFALGSAYIERERLLRTRPMDRSDFEMKFKNLYKVDPDTANKYWDRWDSEP